MSAQKQRSRQTGDADSGRPDDMSAQEARQHRQNLASGSRNPAEVASDWSKEVLRSELSDPSKDLLRNLIAKDWILANFEDDETHELKWKLASRRELFLAAHPAPESDVTGRWRAAINDNPRDRLEPLSQQETMIVDNLFQGIYARITRGRGMKQQEIFRKTINESRAVRMEDESTSTGGLLGRLRS